MRARHAFWGLLLLWGCNFDPAVAPTFSCESDSDCRDGRVCAQGKCANTDSVADASAPDADGVDPGCVADRDGDGARFGPSCSDETIDCDDNDPDIFPGADPACNGRDNDCDGEVDSIGCECTNGLLSECGLSVGTCETGTRTCNDGVWGSCDDVQPADETCNGVDDDCDGTIDEGCPCDIGDMQSCGVDQGACQPGWQTCDDGMWSDCEGAVGPSEELCNALDDDCDGVVDNSPTDIGAPCDAGATGACAGGSEVCRAGGLTCESGQGGVEMCNGVDDDCDGDVDEDLTQACTDTCGAGVQACDFGMWGPCLPDVPPVELCNGIDDDCDNLVDESYPEDGTSCDTGQLGPCSAGSWQCAGTGLECSPNTGPASEVCDGVDNDCDGAVDEGLDGLALVEVCGGACPAGAVRLCEGAMWSACEIRDVELCNGADDNCDGVADNISACWATCPGGGLAVGTRDCASAGCKLPAEICGDGVDNDCDGAVDQNCDDSVANMVYVPGGTFRMGSGATSPDAASDEQPIHTVELASYYIDRYEISRAQYGDCVLAGQCSTLQFGCPLQLTQRDSPITCVTFDQARSYCAWRNKRLPSEAEWEKAARGPFDREVLWPWGDAADASRAAMDCSLSLNACTAPVNSMPAGASYYGLRHMAGNAAEWVSDFYDPAFYTPAYTVQPLNGTDGGEGHVLRGGGWQQELQFGRVANRATADQISANQRGFRCAK